MVHIRTLKVKHCCDQLFLGRMLLFYWFLMPNTSSKMIFLYTSHPLFRFVKSQRHHNVFWSKSCFSRVNCFCKIIIIIMIIIIIKIISIRSIGLEVFFFLFLLLLFLNNFIHQCQKLNIFMWMFVESNFQKVLSFNNWFFSCYSPF